MKKRVTSLFPSAALYFSCMAQSCRWRSDVTSTSAGALEVSSAPAEHHYLSHYSIPADPRSLCGTPITLPTNPKEEVAFKSNLLKSFPQKNIRNVSVVAHVDHGKTTLSDAMLRFAGLLPSDGATTTFTDRLQVEKERGITIKAQTCSIILTKKQTGEQFLINLIDTPGHVDFQYEVSRSLCASEGAALLVDVRQGVEAQTMAQFYASLEQDLMLIPVLTKMDGVMSDAQVEKVLLQLEDSTGLLRREVVLTSAKEKKGIEMLFYHLLDRVPPPCGVEGFSDVKQLPNMRPDSDEKKAAEATLVPLRALLFDCWTAESGGIESGPIVNHSFAATATASATAMPPTSTSVSGGSPVSSDGIYGLIRVIDGTVTPGTVITFFHSKKRQEVREVGIIHPTLHPTAALTAGMVGYVFFPNLSKKEVLIGDTVCTLPTRHHSFAARTSAPAPAEASVSPSVPSTAGSNEDEKQQRPSESTSSYVVQPVPGFKTVQPVVFAGFYPDEGEYVVQLRSAVDLLCVNDPSVTVETMQCPALGSGLQLGFLGFLHMQVFKERLLLEFGQTVLVTPPQVQFMCVEQHGDLADPRQHKPITVSTWRWPHEGVEAYLEPVVTATILTPSEYFNAINSAAMSSFRGELEDMRIVDDARTLARYRMPLAELARGFFSVVKSSSHGYAMLEYDTPTYVPADLVKVDIVINKARISALSTICLRHNAPAEARRILGVLKENLNRSTVDLPLQALVGSKIISRETIKGYRKDVTAKIHAGDISRKQKKWNDQKKGKERMARRSVGTVMLDQGILAAAMGATTVGQR